MPVITLDEIVVYEGNDYFTMRPNDISSSASGYRDGMLYGETLSFDPYAGMKQEGYMDGQNRYTQKMLDLARTWNLDPTAPRGPVPYTDPSVVSDYYQHWEENYLFQIEFFGGFEPDNPDAVESEIAQLYQDAIIDHSADQNLISLVGGIKGYESYTVQQFVDQNVQGRVLRIIPEEHLGLRIIDLLNDGGKEAKSTLKLLSRKEYRK